MASGWNLWVWLVGVAVRRYIDTIKAGCPRTTLTMENVSSVWVAITPTIQYTDVEQECMEWCTEISLLSAYSLLSA